MIVASVGALLLFAAAVHHALELSSLNSLVGPAAAFLIDGGLSAGLIYGGWWLHHRDLGSTETWDVAKWTVLGGIAGAVIAALTLAVQVIENRPIAEPMFRVLVAAAGGAVVLFVAGYYAAQTAALSRRYESIFNNTFQFTGLLRPDGTLVEVNQAALRLGGLERGEVVGQQFDAISWWTHAESVRERLQEAIQQAANGTAVRYETEIEGDDGLRKIDFSARPVTATSGAVTGIVVEGHDITEQELQRQHLQVIQRVVRHNIRNDIIKLRGCMQQLTTADALATREAHADRMSDILEDWEKMTNDLAGTQRTLGRTPDEHTPIPVKDLITDVVTTKRSANPQAQITVTLPEEPVGAVRSTVGEAFEEIIDNAISAACEKPPRIEIDIVRDGEWTEIEIADNGPGLPSAEASVLETGEETQLIHGKGLGVWKVRMLIKRAGGNVAVTASDAGTTISVQLPTSGANGIDARVETAARSPLESP